MKRSLPGIYFALGGILVIATVAAKKIDLEPLDRSNAFMWGMCAVAMVLFACGLVLALRNLFVGLCRGLSWTFAGLNLLIAAAIFAVHINEYVVFSRIYALPLSPTQILPKLIDNVGTAKTESQRRGWAKAAYQTFGIDLTYRADDGSIVLYVPSDSDQKFWQHLHAQEQRNGSLRESIIGGQLRQLPTILALNGFAFVVTFLIGAAAVGFVESTNSRA